MANNRIFDEYNPAVEWSRSDEADAVRISLPGKQPLGSFPEEKLGDGSRMACALLASDGYHY
jgi:hypothetical protein